VAQAKSYQHAGKRWVVDMDLAKFFDEVNHDILISRIARPWDRKFLGYSFTAHKQCKVRMPAASVIRFRKRLKVLFRMGRGRNLSRFIQKDLNPVIRGWINYFRLSETKGFAEELDQWIRRRLRLILWRQWKRPWTRFKNLMKFGIAEKRAARSAFNGRGPWFNSGSSHMNHAFPKKFFDGIGLISTLERLRSFRTALT